MKLQSLSEIENSIGGRPKQYKKVRMTFYLSEDEAKRLKIQTRDDDKTVSQVMRALVRKCLDGTI